MKATCGSYHNNYCSDPTCWGRNYILKWVFFVQSILFDRYIHSKELWVVSLKSSSSVELETKNFFEFCFFRGVIEGWIFVWTTGYLAWFCSLLVQFFFKLRPFNKILIQNSVSRLKINQFWVPNRRTKGDEKTSSGLIGKRTIEKIQILFESSFPRNIIFIFVFLSHLATSNFSSRGSVNVNLNYSLMKPNEEKIRFQGINRVFFCFDSEFS